MQRRQSRGAALLVAASFLLLLAQPGSAATPTPENDSFYAVPGHLAGKPNGTVLRYRPIDASAYVIPLPVTAWQIQFKTTDTGGRATAAVTTLLVPTMAWSGAGPRPLVSYQTAEDGVAGKCSPSYALRSGLAGGSSNSELETGLMTLALLRGWAVAAPDYEGPRSAFLGGPGEAHGVLDGIRAVLRFAPAKLSRTAPIGMWGYSGGAFATAHAAQAQPTYAHELTLTAIAMGGVVADLDATIRAFSSTGLGGAIPMGVNGVMRAYPGYHLENYLSAKGKAAVAATAHDCINDAVQRYPLLTVAQIEAFPGAFDLPSIQHLLRANSPLGTRGTPTAPVYDYHATLDELAPVGPDRELVKMYCAHGAVVQHVEALTGEHISETGSGAVGALQFLANRFAGVAPVSTC